MARRRTTILPSRVLPATRGRARRADADYGAGAQPDWRAVDWRSHLHDAEIEGRRVHYVDIGSGDDPPVVFVHGLGGCWQNWLENIPRVARERRVIALDLPGFGKSDLPAGRLEISGFARTVEALCERLETGPVALVGNSMGGFTAAELTVQNPTRVDQLVLVDAALIAMAKLRPELSVALMHFISAGSISSTKAGARALVKRPKLRHYALASVMRHPTRLSADLLYEQIRGFNTRALAPAMRALTSYDLIDRLPEIACPTLVVHGREDSLVPLADAHELERLISTARVLILDDTGHVPQLERPRAFNAALLAFLGESARETAAQATEEV